MPDFNNEYEPVGNDDYGIENYYSLVDDNPTDEDDGQPSELQENQDFAHDDDMSNISAADIY